MDLLERFAAGDQEAFESLFRQHQRDVYRWVMRIVRNRAIAEDLTIETFWRAYRAHARFDAKRGHCAGWLRPGARMYCPGRGPATVREKHWRAPALRLLNNIGRRV